MKKNRFFLKALGSIQLGFILLIALAQLSLLQAGANTPEAFFNDGIQAYVSARYQEAIDAWMDGLELAKARNDRKYIGIFSGNIGIAYSNLGQYQNAIQYHEQALQIHRQMKDIVGESSDLTNIAVIYDEVGHYEKALEYYGQALSIDTRRNDENAMAASLTNIADVYMNLKNYGSALDHYEKALRVYERTGDMKNKSISLTNIGTAYKAIGKHKSALGYFAKAALVDIKMDDRKGQRIDLKNISDAYKAMGETDRAATYYHYATSDALIPGQIISDLRTMAAGRNNTHNTPVRTAGNAPERGNDFIQNECNRAIILYTEGKFCKAKDVLGTIVSECDNSEVAYQVLRKSKTKCSAASETDNPPLPDQNRRCELHIPAGWVPGSNVMGVLPVFIGPNFTGAEKNKIRSHLSQEKIHDRLQKNVPRISYKVVSPSDYKSFLDCIGQDNLSHIVLPQEGAEKMILSAIFGGKKLENLAKVLDASDQMHLKKLLYKENLKYAFFVKIEKNMDASKREDKTISRITYNVYSYKKVEKPIIKNTYNEFNALSRLDSMLWAFEESIKEHFTF